MRNIVHLEPSEWKAIQSGMRKVVESKYYFNDIGVTVAGKTGTAEENKNRANHALFVGFAPYEEPEISIATRIAYGYTSTYAAQLSKDVIRYYYELASEEELITGNAIKMTDSTAVTD